MKIKSIIISIVVLLVCFLLIAPYQVVGQQIRQVDNKQQASLTAVHQLSPEEKKWFAKFQEGTFYAQGWKDISKDILSKTPNNLLEKQRVALESLGVKIGCEWSKNNDIRKIDNDMLKKWGSLLKETVGQNPHQVKDVIAEIDQKVEMLLN